MLEPRVLQRTEEIFPQGYLEKVMAAASKVQSRRPKEITMTNIQRKALDRRLYEEAVDVFTAEGGRVQPSAPREEPMPSPRLPEHPLPLVVKQRNFAAPTAAERELMAALDIHFGAGGFEFESYRYDRLPDAVLYAKLARRRRDANGDHRS